MIGKIRGEYYYDIHIFNRVCKLVGMTGTGKTLIENAVDGVYKGGCTFTCDNAFITEILFIPSNMAIKDVISLLDSRTNCIIFIDEGISNRFSISQLVLLRKLVINNNYLVFIDRDNKDNYNYDVKAVLNVSHFRDNRIIHPVYNIRSRISAFDNIVTEDSKSGLSIITRLFHKTCNSSFGKSNISGLIKIQANTDNKDILLYIVDGSVFGNHIEACIKAYGNGNVHFIFMPSLEYLLLTSMKLVDKELLDYESFIGGLDDGLKSVKFDIGLANIKTPERYYEWLLKTSLKQAYDIEYSKKNISNIIDLIEFNLFRKELFKYLDSYWGYIELHDGIKEKENFNNMFESFRDNFK